METGERRSPLLGWLVTISLFAYLVVAALGYYHGFFSRFDPNELRITGGGLGLPTAP